MALSPTNVGKALADYFLAQKPADGHAMTNAEYESVWQGAMAIIYNDIKANMDVLPSGHSGSLTVPTAIPVGVTSGPGAGSTGATTSPETVTGMGSVQ